MQPNHDSPPNAAAGACPVPDVGPRDCVLLAHGDGGRLMRRLLDEVVFPALPHVARLCDAAVLPTLSGAPVFTTDSYVVSPLFFPGGDIGSLAVTGTANDLAVSGARPRWLSLSLILEEGLPLDELRHVLASVARATTEQHVTIVTGDTKVVPRGAADKLFINTAGLGEAFYSLPGPAQLAPGDELLVSGPIGGHGTAVLAARERLPFDPLPATDCAPLYPAVAALQAAGIAARAVRDATRGGVAAVLHEWAAACRRTLVIESALVPVTDSVRGVCELLGLDPLHLACEGVMVAAVPATDTPAALAALHGVPVSERAQSLGRVADWLGAPVVVRRPLGQLVPLDEPLGAPLPRIC